MQANRKSIVKSEFNITPTRLALLRFLFDKPKYSVAALADVLAPRKWGWTAQGAARWGGGYVKPMESAGLVLVNRHVRSGVGYVSLSEAGRAIVEAQDAADDPSVQQLDMVVARCLAAGS